MSDSDLRSEALVLLIEWYESQRPTETPEPDRYVVCAGLAVLEHMRKTFPLGHSDFITDGNQVRTGGPFIRNVLARFGERRLYASEGGRTTRGTRPAAEALVARLNRIEALASLSPDALNGLIDELQGWLALKATEYFERRRIEVEINLDRPGPLIIGDLLAVASGRRQGGQVAQHLVGAKLALRFPHLAVENHSYTTADQQLGRSGDFLIGDTVFHVTVAPAMAVLEKCQANIRKGYRAILLVPYGKVAGAVQNAETVSLHDKVGIQAIESFVGQNIEELCEFGKTNLAGGYRQLLETYNRRVSEVEADRSFLIEIPENL